MAGASVLGLDVGGANLKAVHSNGVATSVPFALWRQPDSLAERLRALIESLPPASCLAVTMTGELCDCFARRRDGVQAILDAVVAVAGRTSVLVWRKPGQFVTVAEARQRPLQVAAANWLALAAWAASLVPTDGLLIDIGSTTTDLVPLRRGRPAPHAWEDLDRLEVGELVYTGVRRTPLCALLGPHFAAEWFATTLDAYLILGDLPETPDDRDTADGRPATRAAAHARVARMLCADVETTTHSQRQSVAAAARDRQVTILTAVLKTVVPDYRPEVVILAGAGEFLGRLVLARCLKWIGKPISLNEQLGPAISQAACAYALCELARRSP